MYIYHSIPLFVGHILNYGIPGIARVIDNDIDAPIGVKGCFDQLSREGRICHITCHHDGLAARIVYGACSLLCRVGVKITHDD